MTVGHWAARSTIVQLENAFRWLGLGLLLCIGVGGTSALIQFSREAAADETFCFSSAYTAARLAVRHEASGNMQDFGWFEAQTRRYGFKAIDIFAGNPPSAALVMVPIAELKHPQARVVWTWLSLLFWLAGVAILGIDMATRCGGSAIAAAPGLLCLAVLFDPLKSNIEVAHVYVFAFLLQSIGCWLWLRRRPAAAGSFVGALLAFKGYGVPLIVLGVLRRDWRFTGCAAAAFAGVATLAGALLGFRQWVYFAETYLGPSISGTRTPALQTLKSFLSYALRLPTTQRGPFKVLTPSAEHLLTALLSLAFAGLLVWLSEFRLSDWRTSARAVMPPSPAVLCACVLMNLIFSPWAEDHAYPMAMTALLLMIPELRRGGIVAVGVIVGGVLLSWPFHLADRMLIGPWNLLTDFARLWGANILLAAALLAEYRRRRGSQAVSDGWPGAVVACSLGIVLTLWYVKPWRNPIEHGPLLAVSQTEANKVTLLRLDLDDRAVATIPLSCSGPFGLTFGPRRDWLYAGCRNQPEVSIINLHRRHESTKFAVPPTPAWARLRTGSDEIWISNKTSNKVTIYQAGTSTLLGEFSADAGPSDIAFSEGGKLAWVSNEDGNTVSLVDATSRQKIRDIPVGRRPQGMTITPAGDRLLVANFASATVSVVDTSGSRELTQIPVCAGPADVVTTHDSGVELAYVSCFADGSVSVIDVDRLREIQRVPVGKEPFGIAVHPNGRRVYVCVGGSDRLVALETGRPSRVLRRIKLDGDPLQIAVAP
jgi:YVTN family beta-propeller protein